MGDTALQRTELPLTYVKGIGPRRAQALADEGIVTPADVVLRAPYGYVERSAAPSLASLVETLRRPDLWTVDASMAVRYTAETSVLVTVIDVHEQTVGRGRRMLKVYVTDHSRARASLVFWNAIDWHRKGLEKGQMYLVSGNPDYDQRWGELSFHHPDVQKIDEEDLATFTSGGILPKYRLSQRMVTSGITMKVMRHLVATVIDDALALATDPLPEELVRRYGFLGHAEALRELHLPTSMSRVTTALRRMKFEELFLFELLLAARHNSRRRPERGLPWQSKSPRARTVVEQLPYELTRAQRRVIHEIMTDMTSGAPMNRLLQGDVGSGKTIVAALCMLSAVDNGYQALIMAPTEILAEQHYQSLTKLFDGTDTRVVQLVGGQRKRARREVLDKIVSGEAHVIVGTHALFEANVDYHKLGLIVIDEQHRFGVAQRAELRRLGIQSHGEQPLTPHILVMSATPIPRTLSMTVYGDLDVSVIDELPKHRSPIRTHIVFESRLPGVFDHIRQQVHEGRQAYIVYPLVEKSEKLNLKSAVEHHEYLSQEVFPDLKVGLLHGQMLWYEKEDAMKAFLQKEYDVLVATTVIEVGIDVPNATVMLIENAERFGLSQLHQLRGRVGRGAHVSTCFLATKDEFRYKVSATNAAEERAAAVVRLRTMEETTDGFRIAEVDMRLRGPGDVLGTRQSGLPDFVFTDLASDVDIIAEARREAFALLGSDPKLIRPEHAIVKDRLLRLFDGSAAFMSVA